MQNYKVSAKYTNFLHLNTNTAQKKIIPPINKKQSRPTIKSDSSAFSLPTFNIQAISRRHTPSPVRCQLSVVCFNAPSHHRTIAPFMFVRCLLSVVRCLLYGYEMRKL